MKKLLISSLFLLTLLTSIIAEHVVRATFYTSSVGSVTADGSRINTHLLKKGRIRWVALSRDLLGKKYYYGDIL